METVISILRGINVSGKNKIPMVELKALYEKSGFKNVTTYIQSGNVVFSSKESDLKELPSKIQQIVFKKFGFNVPVIVRTVDEMQKVVELNPLLKKNNVGVQ